MQKINDNCFCSFALIDMCSYKEMFHKIRSNCNKKFYCKDFHSTLYFYKYQFRFGKKLHIEHVLAHLR